MNKDNESEANTGQLGNYQIQRIGEEEVSTAVRRMKSGKAVVPDKGWTFISGPTFESVDDMRCEGGKQVERDLERWRYARERRGMTASTCETEYMCVNGREGVDSEDG